MQLIAWNNQYIKGLIYHRFPEELIVTRCFKNLQMIASKWLHRLNKDKHLRKLRQLHISSMLYEAPNFNWKYLTRLHVRKESRKYFDFFFS